MARKLLRTSFLTTLPHKGNKVNINFSDIPRGLDFQRVANFSETTILTWTDPLLIFKGNSALELNLELDYVAGIHLDSIEQLMKYAQMWQSLPMLTADGDTTRANEINSPTPVLLRIENLVNLKGVIKSCKVSFEDTYTWDDANGKDFYARGKNQYASPIGFRVNFTFIASRSYNNKTAAGSVESEEDKKKSNTSVQWDSESILSNFYVDGG